MDTTTVPSSYHTDTWHDLPHFTCTYCGYDTLQEPRILAHVEVCSLKPPTVQVPNGSLEEAEEPKPPDVPPLPGEPEPEAPVPMPPADPEPDEAEEEA